MSTQQRQTRPAALASPPKSAGSSGDPSVERKAVRSGAGILPRRLFQEAVEQSPVAISMTDTEANILYANAAFERVTGYRHADVIRQNESILSDRSTPGEVYEGLWEALRRGQPWSGRLINRHKDGTPYLAELTAAPVFGQGGEMTHYLAMHRDVTDMYRLEQQVHNQKALIEAVVDALPVVVALFDENDRIVLDNHAYKKLVGDLGGEPGTVILKVLRQSMGEAFKQAQRQGTGFEHQEVYLESGSRGGRRWFSCSVTWFAEQDVRADAFFTPRKQSYLLLVANEITVLKRQQEERRTTVLRALTAEQERVEAMREALGGAAYQLDQPMNLIGSAMGVVQRRAAGGASSGALLDVLRQALKVGREAQETLRQSMPEVRSEAMAPVNLNQVLRDVLAMFTERLLAIGVTVDWRPASVLPAFVGREGRLRGLFKQLIDNAIDALEALRGKQRELRVVTQSDGQTILVSIQDTGPGIPEPIRFKVFEPFFSTKGPATNGGVGLSMAQQIVNEHAGTLGIDEDCRHGCRVVVRLPIGPPNDPEPYVGEP
jgi:nitrogen fixation negative regulator NifL